MVSEQLRAVLPTFPSEMVLSAASEALPRLPLKKRIEWIAGRLLVELPENYERVIDLLIESLPDSTPGDDFGSYAYAPYLQIVRTSADRLANFDVSLDALQRMTCYFSAEDAIRPFIAADPPRVMTRMLKWTGEPDHRVRRLASEGSRPLLPWSERISLPPDWAVPILERLWRDNSRFVTRSVANHMNDISRLDAAAAVGILSHWTTAAASESGTDIGFIRHQGLRTLVKNGDRRALELVGATVDAAVEVKLVHIGPTVVSIGDSLEIELRIASERDAVVVVDYTIERPTLRGRSRKVFKLSTRSLRAGVPVELRKVIPMRPLKTRRLLPGAYRIEILANGIPSASASFDAVESQDV